MPLESHHALNRGSVTASSCSWLVMLASMSPERSFGNTDCAAHRSRDLPALDENRVFPYGMSA